MQNFQEVLQNIYKNVITISDKGSVASQIPDFNKKFSIQSISKVLTLSLASSLIGEKILERVDVEPSGNPFNQLSLLERENGIPRNPLINSGAIVIADILISNLKNPKDDFLDYIRDLVDDNSIQYNLKVAQSEKLTGFKPSTNLEDGLMRILNAAKA